MSETKSGEASYYNARNCLLFNEHRRLYMALDDGDAERLAGVYGMPAAEAQEAIRECEARLEGTASRLLPGPVPAAVAAAGSILFIGDSNSANRMSYVNVIRKRLEREGLAVVDTSICGLTSQDVVDHFADQVLERRPRIACVMIGTNDVRRSSPPGAKNITGLPEFEANMRFILGGLESIEAKALALTIPPMDSDRMLKVYWPRAWTADAGEIASYNAAIARAASGSGARLVDAAALFASADSGLALVDGLHLSPESHERIARLVWDGLLDLGKG
jgi:lysophospholipase L1-like esterase